MKRSKIEEIKAKDFIKKIYPNASFWKEKRSEENRENIYHIVFEQNGKVYSYRSINTLTFLKRIKVIDDNVMYKNDYENLEALINELEIKIKDNNYIDFFGLGFVEKEKQEDIKKLKLLKENLQKAKILEY